MHKWAFFPYSLSPSYILALYVKAMQLLQLKKKQKQTKERLVRLKPIQEYDISLSNGELHCVAISSEWVRVKREKMKQEGNEAK